MSSREAIAQQWAHYSAWHRRLFVVSLLAAMGALAETAIVLIVAKFATLAASGRSRTVPLFGGRLELGVGALLALGVALVAGRLALEIVGGRVQASVVASYDAQQRARIARSFAAASWPAQARARRGELLDLLTSYLNQTRVAALAFSDAIVAGLAFMVLLIAGVVTGGWVALVLVGILAVLALGLRRVAAWTRRSARGVALATPVFANRFTELVDLARPIKAFDVGEPAVDRVSRSVRDLREAWRHLYIAQTVGPAIVQAALLLLAVVGLAILVWSNASNPTAYVASILLLYRSSQYARALQSAIQSLTIAGPFLARIDEQVEQFDTASEPAGHDAMPALAEIGLCDVTFGYGDGHAPVLDRVSMSIQRGEIVGLAGRSGAGKTTIVDLLLRLERPQHGELLLNGRPIEHVALASWRQAVALVPQEGVLLDDTVAANVRFLRDDIDDEAVIEALRATHVLDEVRALPGGLDAPVGERGDRLSVGQRQRICIARALAGHPELLILDEPTSALDPAAASVVCRTIASLRSTVTVVLVSHREDTLEICDRVIDLDAPRPGEVVPGP
jgi:ABC-type multidrug transport system fused ATPase/permease subunit